MTSRVILAPNPGPMTLEGTNTYALGAPGSATCVIVDPGHDWGDGVMYAHGVENRFPVSIDKVPPVVTAAVVSAEDRKFFVHKGIDPLGIARALWADIRSKGVVQGGSTITQQLVKQTLLQAATTAEERQAATESSIGRKLREARLALALDSLAVLDRDARTAKGGAPCKAR